MLGDALVSTLQRLPSAKWVFTTLGVRGAVLLQRAPPEEARGGVLRRLKWFRSHTLHTAGFLVPVHQCKTVLLAEQLALQDLLRRMWEELDRRKPEADAEPACTTANGMQIRFPSGNPQSEKQSSGDASKHTMDGIRLQAV